MEKKSVRNGFGRATYSIEEDCMFVIGVESSFLVVACADLEKWCMMTISPRSWVKGGFDLVNRLPCGSPLSYEDN